MRHRKHTFKIGRTSAHRKALLANMACSLIEEGQIRTTVTKAKELRRLVERMITLGKRGSLHARRQAIARLRQPAIVRVLFDDVAPKFADRNGGYTRILKLNERVGDSAAMCLIQLVTEPVSPKVKQQETLPAEPASEDAATVEMAGEVATPAIEESAEATVDEVEEETVEEVVEADEEATVSDEAQETEGEAGEEMIDEESDKK